MKASTDEKKGHVCPHSDATHPKDRWETAFIYSFICKFTQLKSKIDGFHSAMDLEDALMTAPGEVNKLLQDVLTRFILMLRPHSRNVGPSQLNATVCGLLSDFLRTSERSVFWDDARKVNDDPLVNLKGGFWGADWDLKLKILRQLVEYQLTHSQQIRELLDRAWGVKQMQHKKKEPDWTPPDSDDPFSQNNLLLRPIGLDIDRQRYWVLDNSPRLYLSTNPWKVTSSFRSLSDYREEYLKAIQVLKDKLPSGGSKLTKLEICHRNLVDALEARLESVDAELARIERVRKKIEQRNLLLAQAEVRGPRTRRQLRRPEYVYNDTFNSDEDEQDEYKYEEEPDQEEANFEDISDGWPEGSGRPRRNTQRNGSDGGLRRSSRQTNGKPSYSDDVPEWRGERRSRRLESAMDADDAPPRKRSRTVDSSEAGSVSSHVLPGVSGTTSKNGLPTTSGAAALKPTEVAVEAVHGKKKNKYWFYAVEPIMPSPAPPAADETEDAQMEDENKLPGFNGKSTKRIVDSVEPESRGHSEVPSTAGLQSSAPMSLDSTGEEDE